MKTMTPKQKVFIGNLAEHRELSDDLLDRLRQTVARGMSTTQASETIKWLLKQPEKSEATPIGARRHDTPVPAGRYAVQIGDWQFFHVWRGTRDASVVHVYAARGMERGKRLAWKQEADVLALIALDPAAAAEEFGHRTGHCYRCGTALDVNLSRKLGMGPTCMTYVYDRETRLAKLAAARKELRDAGVDPNEKLDDLAVAA